MTVKQGVITGISQTLVGSSGLDMVGIIYLSIIFLIIYIYIHMISSLVITFLYVPGVSVLCSDLGLLSQSHHLLLGVWFPPKIMGYCIPTSLLIILTICFAATWLIPALSRFRRPIFIDHHFDESCSAICLRIHLTACLLAEFLYHFLLNHPYVIG